MEIEFTTKADEDLFFWKRANNTANLKKIRTLLESILESPYSGIGKPEALKHELSGKWSRRITKSDRIIYQILENKLYVFSLRGHYK